MRSPEDDFRAAAEADCHLQLAVESIRLEPGTAHLSGTVVRVFRGPAALNGTRMTLAVASTGDGDGDWPPDGIGRIPVDRLRTGQVIEAYVNTPASGPEVLLDLYTLLDAATETPQLRIGSDAVAQLPRSTRIPAFGWVVAAVALAAASLLVLAR